MRRVGTPVGTIDIRYFIDAPEASPPRSLVNRLSKTMREEVQFR